MTGRAEGSGGYRGALPPRQDALAAPWVIAVVAIFVLIFALSLAGLPSNLLASPSPIPSGLPSASAGPSASGSGG
jgi:thiol:disulfide interchange protein